MRSDRLRVAIIAVAFATGGLMLWSMWREPTRLAFNASLPRVTQYETFARMSLDPTVRHASGHEVRGPRAFKALLLTVPWGRPRHLLALQWPGVLDVEVVHGEVVVRITDREHVRCE